MSKSNCVPVWDVGNNLISSGLPITSLSGSGGGMTLIGSYDSSVNGAIANYTLTWTATYKQLLLITKNITGSGGGAYFILQTSDNSGSTWGNELNMNQPNVGSYVLLYSATTMYNTNVSGLTKDMIIAANPAYSANNNSSLCNTSSTTGIINGIKYSYVSSAQNINGGRIFVYGIN